MTIAWVGPARRIALRIDADTLRGARHGVPRLTELLQRHEAGAAFLFNIGPDHSGRALARLLRERHMRRAAGTSLVRRHGIGALLYGTLLPGPDVGEQCGDVMRAVRAAGFETGIRALNGIGWRAQAAVADAGWTLAQMQTARQRYEQILGEAARVHAAPGRQVSRHSLRFAQRLGADYCSDTRGTHPYIPIWDAEIIACPQIPVTLPGFGELLERGTPAADLAVRLFEIAASTATVAGHVLRVQADLEGLSLLDCFDALLRACRAHGIEILSLGAYLEAAGAADLPRHRVVMERTGDAEAAVQGPEFLGE